METDTRHCPYCTGGSHYKEGCTTAQERCDTALPCFHCEGSGRTGADRFQYVSNLKITHVSDTTLDPASFNVKRRVTVEFDYCLPAQQDGRPPPEAWLWCIRAIQFGKHLVTAVVGRAKGELT